MKPRVYADVGFAGILLGMVILLGGVIYSVVHMRIAKPVLVHAYTCKLPRVEFALTPAPRDETLLHRWQRAKDDYARAAAIERNFDVALDACRIAVDERPEITAIGPLSDAEAAMADAKCDDVCKHP